jgi:hypothetical protein
MDGNTVEPEDAPHETTPESPMDVATAGAAAPGTDPAALPPLSVDDADDSEAETPEAQIEDVAVVPAASDILLPRVGWAIATRLPDGFLGGHRRQTRRRRAVLAGGTVALIVVTVAAGTMAFLNGGRGSTAPTASDRSSLVAVSSAEVSSEPAASATVDASTDPGPTAAVPAVSDDSGPSSPPGPITEITIVSSSSGALDWTDDFRSPSTGWITESSSEHTRYAYTSAGYVVASQGGPLHHLVYAPYNLAVAQLSVRLTATQVASGSRVGFGVTCRRGSGAEQVAYEFIVLNDGRYFVERRDGEPSLATAPWILVNGISPSVPGTKPVTVVGMCATLADGRTTRLILLVDGATLADFTDATNLPGSGWLAGIDVVSNTKPSTTTATSFEVRDLAR